MERSSAAVVDGIRLIELAEELPIGRSSVFELLKGLGVKTAKGPGANGKGRVAWVSSADASRLREAARAVHNGERKISDFTVSIAHLRTPPTLSKRPTAPSADSADPAAFLARLEAAERAVNSGLGLTTAEAAWILGKEPRGASCTKGGITAVHEGVNCWRLVKTSQVASSS